MNSPWSMLGLPWILMLETRGWRLEPRGPKALQNLSLHKANQTPTWIKSTPSSWMAQIDEDRTRCQRRHHSISQRVICAILWRLAEVCSRVSPTWKAKSRPKSPYQRFVLEITVLPQAWINLTLESRISQGTTRFKLRAKANSRSKLIQRFSPRISRTKNPSKYRN